MTASPNPDIVTKLYNLDTGTFITGPVRRWDGTLADADEVNALTAARSVDFDAVLELHRLALEQSEFELARKVRIGELAGKYATGDNEELGVIEARMTREDRAEWDRLWADLGNVMVLTGGADR